MGKCSERVLKITFDFSDEQITTVEVLIDYEGDCPLMDRVYRKSFPARIPAVDLFTMDGGIKDHLVWD